MALERKALEDAFANVDKKDLEVTFMDAPITLERIEEELRKGYHILHYLGHGAYNSKRQQAALYLQDADGHAKRALDDEIVAMVARQGVRPHLIFLAACQSAVRSSADAFVGLGPKLVSAGVPAVIAMQDFVTVDTARKYSSVFYKRLVEHGQIDRAGNEARSSLLTAGRPDAIVPVLFMRLKSAQSVEHRSRCARRSAGLQESQDFLDGPDPHDSTGQVHAHHRPARAWPLGSDS